MIVLAGAPFHNDEKKQGEKMQRFFGVFLALFLLAAPALAADGTLLINGTLVTPGRVIQNGWVAIQGGKIAAISDTRPAIPGARTLVTRDIVFPGFVDLHNHPLYAVFPRWHPPKVYPNRYEWRADAGYWQAIQTPEGKLVASRFCDMDTYVEMKALMGGTTSMLGIYRPADTAVIPACVAGLVRNLDWASGLHGEGVGHERAGNILGVRPADLKLSAETLEQAKRGPIDLIAVHLGEGQRGDPDSRAEFARLKELKLLTPNTAIIHGIALSESDFGEIKAAGASFIWSPRSNFELYGETADLAAAVRQKVTMALAPDWSPTGSVNMLAEIGYAKSVIDRQFKGLISARQLFEMATAVPARIARIDDKVGSLKPGLAADLFLLRGDVSNPFDALAAAKPQDVTLTMIDGVPLFGIPDHLSALGVAPLETVNLCGQDRGINGRAITDGFADITARLTGALRAETLTLAGLAECN